MAQMNNDTPGNKLTYGWFSVRPRCLQFLNTPRWLLFFLSQYIFTQNGVMSGILPASVSSIERIFGFSSNMMGVLISMYDIASLLATPFIGYLGETRRKGVWCAFGLLTLGLGYFVFLIPHLIVGHYEAGSVWFKDQTLCGSPNQTNITRDQECKKVDGSTNIGLYIVFLFAQILTGSGSVPMVVLAVPFLDENVSNKVLPIFLGWFFTAGIVGVLVGSGLSSVFLSIYVDPGVSPSLTVDDERWVGAWWLGFAIFSAVAVFWGLGIMGFPRQLPGTKATREAAENDKNENLNDNFPVPRFIKFSEMMKATKHMFTYGSYICVTFGVCAEEFIITAIGVFMAKLIQLQFQYTSSFASIMFGLVAGVSALTGNLLGAYINKRLKLNCVGAAKMCFVVGVLGFLSAIPLFLRCDNNPVAGVNSPYPNRSFPTSLISQCNEGCRCTKSLQYNPMCGNGLTYYSSCHAGCTRAVLANKTFSNCSCVLRQGNTILMGGEVTQGECRAECGVIPPIWLTVVFLVTFFTFLNSIPASFTTLRCVPVDQRSYALALQWVFIRLLGTIPGPIVFGYLIDQACVLWDNRCGKLRSCLLYNNKNLGVYVLCICLACKLISLVFFGLTWVFARKQFKRTS